jgi:hypothetical protein
MQELIRHGLISYVSVEHTGPEVFNQATRQMEAASLTFTGFAFVNKGACKLCRINEAPPAAPQREGEHYPWDQCVADQMKAGYDEETAKKICGSIKARNNAEKPPEEAPAMDKKSESFEGRQEQLREKLSAFLGLKYSDGTTRNVWPVLTFPDRLVYQTDEKYFEVSFTVNADGTITFQAPVEVEQVYVEKKALEVFPGADPKELMEVIRKKAPEAKPASPAKTPQGEKRLEEPKMEGKELEAAITAAVTAATAPLQKELEAIKAQKPAEIKVEIPKELAELPAQVKALTDQVKELAARPAAPVGAASGQTKELEATPDYYIPVDRKAGKVG